MRNLGERWQGRPAARVAWLLAIALGASVAALADEAPARERRSIARLVAESRTSPVEAPRVRPRFGAELSRRVEVQLESLSAFQSMSAVGNEAIDNVLHDELTADVRRGMERSTRRAVRDYFLETFAIEQRLDVLTGRVTGGRSASGSPARKRLDVGFGFHSLEPEVDLEYDLDGARIGLALGGGGGVELKYRAGSAKQADVGIGFDGDDAYSFSFRVGF